jgi:AraC-like DNA-binding protein
MAEDDATRRRAVQRLAFSTDRLPEHLDARTRRRLWDEFRNGIFGRFDDTYADDRPFAARGEVALFGSAAVGRIGGTLTRTANSARDIDADSRDDFLFAVNLGPSPIVQRQRRRELVQAPGALGLISSADTGEVLCSPDLDWCSVIVPRKPLRELVADADDLVARAIDPGQPAARYFRRYLTLLLGPDGVEDDPRLSDHVATTLLDLVALCLGAGRDAAEIARMRGLQAARLQLVLAEIRNGHADPAFSPATVARKLGISPRRVQGLLQETGTTFTERVLELRLQRARAMLASRRYDSVKVSEIAFACGFSDISYFNRRFRARFGTSPTQYRGGAQTPP